ncbi:MAG TPA: hypothetical protein VM166_07295 [Gemmatimonadaceae bacterium]|nr:hypothetical protein [Gemmatimonadaceae bacterium]
MSRSRLAGVGVAALVLGACATAPAPEAKDRDKVLVSTELGAIHSNRDVRIARANLKSPRTVVVAVLKDAYEELGIPVKVADPVTGQVGNNYFSKTGHLGSVPLSRYVSCGSTLTGPAADNYRVTLSVLSVVGATGAGSHVETHLTARADPETGNGSLQCESMNTLEEEIHRVLLRRLGDREL